MGQDLCADNPMFQGTIIGGPDVGSQSPGSPEMDLESAADEATGEITDPGLSLDEATIEAPDSDLNMDEQALELPELEVDTEVVEPVDELAFDLSETDAVEETADTEDAFSLDIDASELNIDIQDEAEAEGLDLTDDVEESLDLTDIDIGLDEATDDRSEDVVEAAVEEDVANVVIDDADTGLEVVAADEDIAMDLTEEAEPQDMGMDEDAAEETGADGDTIEAAVISHDFADDEEDFDLSSLDDVDEISTKLDLARAYLDMGDHEGTKGILEEVLVDGDDEQKSEASELMAKLG